MNFFNLINAVLSQLDLPAIKDFDSAKLPIHVKIKAYINRANEDIILSDDWWFTKKCLQINSKKCSHCLPSGENHLVSVSRENDNLNIFYDRKDFVKDEFGNLKKFFDNEFDRSIMPEPFGSDLIIYRVCMELNQEPNNPKYNHWKLRYNNAYAQLRASGKPYDGKPVFKIKRG